MINKINGNFSSVSFKGTLNIDKRETAEKIALFEHEEQQDSIINNIGRLKSRLENETPSERSYYLYLKPIHSIENYDYLNVELRDDKNNIFQSGINMRIWQDPLTGKKTGVNEETVYESGFKSIIENAILSNKKSKTAGTEESNSKYQEKVEQIYKKLDIVL